MLERKYEYGYYTVYLNGEFLTTCDNYTELREIYAEYGISI